MKILVIGSKGMLGSDVLTEALGRGHECKGMDVGELDITDPTALAGLASGEFGVFDWVINCAAYTAVDKAETEIREATELNTLAAGYVATAVQGIGAKLIHISTDFVFDGRATEPYPEDAATNPLGAYGRTKRDGEEAVFANNANALVVRTAWLYGPNGNSFPRTMIRAFLAGKQLRVVGDQVGCPTYTGDLARVLIDLVEKNAFPGIYHAVGPETMSWHEFARRAILSWNGVHGVDGPVEIEPIRTEDWPTPAARPKYSALAMSRLTALGVEPMRPVDQSLAEFCARLGTP
jgi:dTDP-4-dehydrorhamnose reductase